MTGKLVLALFAFAAFAMPAASLQVAPERNLFLLHLLRPIIKHKKQCHAHQPIVKKHPTSHRRRHQAHRRAHRRPVTHRRPVAHRRSKCQKDRRHNERRGHKRVGRAVGAAQSRRLSAKGGDKDQWGKLVKSNESRLKDFQRQLAQLKAQLNQCDKNTAQFAVIKRDIDLLEAFLKKHPNSIVDVKKLNDKNFKAYEKESQKFWKKADSDIKKCSISLRDFQVKIKAPKGPTDNFKPIKNAAAIKAPADIKLKFQQPKAWQLGKDHKKGKKDHKGKPRKPSKPHKPSKPVKTHQKRVGAAK